MSLSQMCFSGGSLRHHVDSGDGHKEGSRVVLRSILAPRSVSDTLRDAMKVFRYKGGTNSTEVEAPWTKLHLQFVDVPCIGFI